MPSVDSKFKEHVFITELQKATTREWDYIYIHVYIKSSYDVKKQGSETEIHYLWSLNALDTNTNP